MFAANQHREKAAEGAELLKRTNVPSKIREFQRSFQRSKQSFRWNTIPTKLQRELFDTAGLLGDVLQTVALRGQIARFLHAHKDGVNSVGCISKSNLMNGKPNGA